MEKRKHLRIPIRDMRVDLSDGMGCCSAEVRDISRVGLCLVDLAKRFGKNVDAFTVVASGKGRHFKFRVRPRWEMAGLFQKMMGVEIFDAPWQWTEFIIHLETDQRGKRQPKNS